MVESHLARGDTHLDFAAHDLLVLFDGSLKRLLQWSEIANIPCKALGFASKADGVAVRR
jgi:hypothetical protein